MLEQQQNMVKAIEFPPCLPSALAPRDRSQLTDLSHVGNSITFIKSFPDQICYEVMAPVW